MQDNEKRSNIEETSGLARSQSVAMALRGTARRLRFSTSNRSELYKAVGLRPRPITQWFSVLFIVTTAFILIIPNIAAIAYYGFIASDQYQSETRFTVRTSTPAIGKDQFAKVTGIPSSKIVQDTQIVTNYLVSQNMLDTLEANLDLAAFYSRDDIDIISRLAPGLPRERMLLYWKKMVSASISVPSGIVTIKLRAFDSQEAQTVLKIVLTHLERVINDMNDRIWRDVTDVAQANLVNASQRLKLARERVQLAQNESGVFTVETSADSLSDLITKLEAERISLQQRYDVNAMSIGRNTPQMRVLNREIESKKEQINSLRTQMTGRQSGTSAPLAQTASNFSQLQLEQQVAEQQFATSVRTLEQVQFSSRQQLMYLDAFVTPTLPQEAQYPQRALWIGLIFVGSVLLWAALWGGLTVLHTRLS